MALREWLKPFPSPDKDLTAKLKIFENCTNLIRTLPLLQYDKRNGTDAANEPHELTHAPDALRYFAAWRQFGDSGVPNENEESRFQITRNYITGLWQ
jgi:phage terminase large subunit